MKDKFLADKSVEGIKILPDYLADNGYSQKEVDRARQEANVFVLLKRATNLAPG